MQLALISQCLLNIELKDQYLEKDLVFSLFTIVLTAACNNALSRTAVAFLGRGIFTVCMLRAHTKVHGLAWPRNFVRFWFVPCIANFKRLELCLYERYFKMCVTTS